MATQSQQPDAERYRRCLLFKDEKYYLEYRSYFDVAGQVHSVVLTKQGAYVLRIWRGIKKFGPKSHEERRESNIFRVTQDIFQSYLAKPDVHIGKCIEVFGKRQLLEICVYDDHEESLKGLCSGDYVAVQNVHHYTKAGCFDALVVHGGSGGHNRGISLIPEDYSSDAFDRLTSSIHEAFAIVEDYEGFVEFEEEEEDAVTAEENVASQPSEPVFKVPPVPLKKQRIDKDSQDLA